VSAENSIWRQIRERRVLPLAAGYFGLGWALVELTDFLVSRYGWPDRLIDLVFAAIGLCLPLALFLIWKIGAPGAARYGRRDLAMIGAGLAFAVSGLYVRNASLPQSDIAVPAAAVVPTPTPPNVHEQTSYVAIFPFTTEGSTEDDWLADGLPILAEYDLEFDPRFFAKAATSTGAIGGLLSIVQRLGAKDLDSAPLAVRRRAAIAGGFRALVAGSIAREDGKLQLKVELHRVRPDQALGPFALSAVDAWDAVDQLAALIRRELAPEKARADGNDPALKSITSDSIPALKSFVDGQLARTLGGDTAAATRAFAAAESTDPTFAIAAYFNLLMRSATQAPTQTISEFEILMPRAEVLPPSYRFAIQVLVARMRGDQPGMRRVLEAWSRAMPWDRTPNYRLASLALEHDPDDAEALRELRELALSSGSAPEIGRLSLTFKGRGYLDEALQLAQAAVELDDSDFGTRIQLAEILQARGELDAAAEQLAIANVLRPDLVSGVLQNARLSFDRGDWRGALQQLDALDQRTRAHPGQRQVWLQTRINLLWRLGRLRAAEPLIEESIALPLAVENPTARAMLYVSYVGLKYQLHGEVGAQAWVTRGPEIVEGHLKPYFASLHEGVIAVAMEDSKRLRGAHAGVVAAYTAMGQVDAERAVAHWLTMSRLWDEDVVMSVSEAKASLADLTRLVRAGAQSEDNLKHAQVVAIRHALRQRDALTARQVLDPRMRAAPGDPELLLLSARTHQVAGANDAAKADLSRALDAWQQADPEFRLAQEAHELLREL
jgi:tetratricopeptide (TPR) repeat protein